MKRKMIAIVGAALLALSLAACGAKPAASPSPTPTPAETNPVELPEEPTGNPEVVVPSETPGEDGAESKTVDGVVNRLGEYLVLLADDDKYYKFDIGSLDVSKLTEGDKVTVTYTGTLAEDASELIPATAIAPTPEKPQK